MAKGQNVSFENCKTMQLFTFFLLISSLLYVLSRFGFSCIVKILLWTQRDTKKHGSLFLIHLSLDIFNCQFQELHIQVETLWARFKNTHAHTKGSLICSIINSVEWDHDEKKKMMKWCVFLCACKRASFLKSVSRWSFDPLRSNHSSRMNGDKTQ